MVGDLVAAEQEAERDQQTACGDERDHVGDAGHQHAADPAAPRLLAGRTWRRPRWRCPRPEGRSGRRRTATPRRSSRRRHRSGASRRRRPSACRRSGRGRGRPRRRRRSRPRRWRSSAADRGVEPAEPWVSTEIGDARLLGGGLERLGGHVGVGDAGRAGGDGDERLRPGRSGRLGSGGRGRVGRGCRRRRAAAGAGVGFAGSSRARSISSTTSSAVSAERRESVNAGLTSERASLVRSWRWVASPPAGAAIRNARSAGPSLAPKSTGGSSRAKARVGSETPVVRQCGIAMPPGRPVLEVSSRANASAMSCSSVVGALGVVDDGGEATDHVGLVRAPAGVEPDQLCGDQIGHALPPKTVTLTSSVRRCAGSGMVVPGRPAAALP